MIQIRPYTYLFVPTYTETTKWTRVRSCSVPGPFRFRTRGLRGFLDRTSRLRHTDGPKTTIRDGTGSGVRRRVGLSLRRLVSPGTTQPWGDGTRRHEVGGVLNR